MSLFSPKIPLIHHLDASFFSGMRNTINLQTLKKLADLAKKIPEPEIFGSYKNEAHFLKTYNFFLKTTNETRHRGIFFSRKVLPGFREKNNLIDIGSANGEFTKWIARGFKNVTVIDCNKIAIKEFNETKTIISKNTTLEKIHDSILEVKLKKSVYDLGVLSHVLYYINESEWIKATEIVYESVKRGGLVVVVLNGDSLDKHHLINYFGAKSINIDGYIEKCFASFPNASIEVFSSTEIAKASTIQAMLHITGFFLYDVKKTATKVQLQEYIDNHLKIGEENYEISFPQKFILIRKLT